MSFQDAVEPCSILDEPQIALNNFMLKSWFGELLHDWYAVSFFGIVRPTSHFEFESTCYFSTSYRGDLMNGAGSRDSDLSFAPKITSNHFTLAPVIQRHKTIPILKLMKVVTDQARKCKYVNSSDILK